ncbi:MAG TPA: iron-sulfur cluster repair di-iron protein, ric [Eubacteriaceae bacterium]|jgi:iron-sulfur cluster repair protein YtfE (RIC family)|nr:iron-sulfur cluster repair di-iron protein, ric [Eubacteriaceae bacterium]
MGNFKDILEQYFKKLELYIPVVERVHGENHPEFYDVRKLFDQIAQKIGNLSKDKPKLDGVFKELRKITDNYTVPEDVCESYQAVYEMLAELDRAYHK